MQMCGGIGLAGRCEPAPGGAAGSAGAHAASHVAYYRRWASTWEFQALLKARPVAGDPELGAAYCAGRGTAGLARRRAPGLRRRRAGDAPAGRRHICPPTSPTGSSSSARAVCATSSSRCSCCSWCTAAPTRRCASAAPWPRSTPCATAGTSAATTPRASPTPTRSCAPPSTGCSWSGCGAPTSCPTDRGGAGPAGARDGVPARTVRGDAGAVWHAEWALHAREVRRLHEKLFYRPLLEAVARVPTEGLRFDAGRGGPPPGCARVRRSARRAAAHRAR